MSNLENIANALQDLTETESELLDWLLEQDSENEMDFEDDPGCFIAVMVKGKTKEDYRDAYDGEQE